jgi:hypothetical protein
VPTSEKEAFLWQDGSREWVSIIKTIKYLNANNAILSTTNAQLVATARARQEAKKGKQVISKARVLSKEDADKLWAEKEAMGAVKAAHKADIQQKKEQMTLKRQRRRQKRLRGLFDTPQPKTRRKSTRRWLEWPKLTSVCLHSCLNRLFRPFLYQK